MLDQYKRERKSQRADRSERPTLARLSIFLHHIFHCFNLKNNIKMTNISHLLTCPSFKSFLEGSYLCGPR